MKKILVLSLVSSLCFSCATVKKSSKAKNQQTTAVTKPQAPKKKQGKIKDYNEVITKDAITDKGLFDVHVVDDKYYFEIPTKYLNTDMLLVSRLAKLPANLGGGYVNAGTKTSTRMINW